MTDTANMRQQEKINTHTDATKLSYQSAKRQAATFPSRARKPVMSVHTRLWFSGC